MISHKRIRSMGSYLTLSLCAIMMLAAEYTHAQAHRGPHEMHFTVFNEAISLPTKSPVWQSGLAMHPGISFGLNKYYKRIGRHYFYWNFTAQYFGHTFVYRSLGLYGSWNYRYAVSKRFNFGFETGLGYMHRFNRMKEFQIKDGAYTQVRKLGLPGVLFSLGAETHWYPKFFVPDGSIFIKYQIQGIYHFAGEVPILPFTLTHIGVSIPMRSTQARRPGEKPKMRKRRRKKQEQEEETIWNDPTK